MVIDLSLDTVTGLKLDLTEIAFAVPVTISHLLRVLEDCRHLLLGFLVVEHEASLLGTNSKDRVSQRPLLEANILAIARINLDELLLGKHRPDQHGVGLFLE